MWTWIFGVEAGAATAAACVAISRWVAWRKLSTGWCILAIDLDAECEEHISSIILLSAKIDKQEAKPGPQKRARERALILTKAAELRGEVIAR